MPYKSSCTKIMRRELEIEAQAAGLSVIVSSPDWITIPDDLGIQQAWVWERFLGITIVNHAPCCLLADGR